MTLGTSGLGITVNKSSTAHGDAILGLIASFGIGKREVVDYYYSSLGCAVLNKRRHKKKDLRVWSNIDDCRAVRTVRKWATGEVVNKNGNEQNVWKFPGLFFHVLYQRCQTITGKHYFGN